MSKEIISVEQLQEGLYIELPLKWSQHPFLLNHFLITSQKQINVIRKIGIKQLYYYSDKSKQKPLPPNQRDNPDSVEDDTANETKDLWNEKVERFKKLKERRKRINKCEKEYVNTIQNVKKLMKELGARPHQAIEEATKMIDNIVDSLLDESELVVHLMNQNNMDETLYYHSLNVTFLSLMLAKASGFSREQMQNIGLGALLHDIGQSKIPSQILRKQTPRNQAEQNFFELHPSYGLHSAEKLDNITEEIKHIIMQHHERNDGTGYPNKLKAEQIDILSKVVIICNSYDNHCNHTNPADSLTPYESLSYMFKQEKAGYDGELLAHLVRCLGIYPPGTVVELSNGTIGIVISLNQGDLLYPSVLIYDAEIPKEEAIIVDLKDSMLKITRSIRPHKLEPEIYEYLSPRTRISYFFESKPSSGNNAKK